MYALLIIIMVMFTELIIITKWFEKIEKISGIFMINMFLVIFLFMGHIGF